MAAPITTLPAPKRAARKTRLRAAPAPGAHRGTITRHWHAGGSLRSRAVSTGARLTVKPMIRVWAINPDLHWPAAIVDRVAALLPTRLQAMTQQVHLPHCEAEWLRAPGVGTERAVLYLHGGGFVMCGLNTHRGLAAQLSSRAEAAVLNVGYRMLPGNPVSSAVEDAVDAYRWLLDIGYDPADIVVAGDSAGGYLSFMAVLSFPEVDLPRPAGIAAISPLTDTDMDRKCETSENDCPMLPLSAVTALGAYLERCHARIAVDDEPGPLVSPVDEDLHGMPPVCIHVGAHELLRPDGELMAERLAEAGRPCELHVWEGQMHDFPLTTTMTPEGIEAIDEVARFVRGATGS